MKSVYVKAHPGMGTTPGANWKRIIKLFFSTFLFTVLPFTALAANYVNPEVFKQWLESNKPVIIIDIQEADDFEEQHFKGAIETNAFPAKTGKDKQKLEPALALIKADKNDVVIACPRGKGGASNTYEHLKSRGVPENRLYILEDGIAG